MHVNQKIYRLILGRHLNFDNVIKHYSMDVALNIFQDLNKSFESVLVFTNAVVNLNQLQSFKEKLWISSHSERVLKTQKYHNMLLASKLADKKFDCTLVDLTLNFANNIPEVLNFYESILNKDGVFVANILGGKSLYELTNSMMEADLSRNRMVPRMLPKISSEMLLQTASKSNFKCPIVMNNEFKLKYESLNNLIQSLREIAHLYPMASSTRDYWKDVEAIYRKNLTATFELLTLFAVKL